MDEEMMEKNDQRIRNMLDALARVPMAKYTQLARIADIQPVQAYRLIMKEEGYFEFYNHGKRYKSNRYKGMEGVSKFIGLNDWGRRCAVYPPQTKPINHVTGKNVARYFQLMDVLLSLIESNMAYGEYDMISYAESKNPLHARVFHIATGFNIGIYLFPQKFGKSTSIAHVANGIAKKVGENIGNGEFLCLVPSKHYAKVLTALTKNSKKLGNMYVLPLESFLRSPYTFLQAIEYGEGENVKKVIDRIHASIPAPTPGQYHFPELVRMEDASFRFIGTFTTGSIKQLNSWCELNRTNGYQVPNEAQIATGSVYVVDPCMRDAVSQAAKKLQEDPFIDVYPYPGVIRA